MKVGEICTKWVDSVLSSDSVINAARHMKERNIGFLPVIEEDDIVGVVTDRDIVVRCLAEDKDPASTMVGDIMTKPIRTCSEEDSIEEAAKLMEDQQVRRLIVVDSQGMLSGILSIGDVATKAHTQGLVGEAVEYISQPCEPRR